MNFYDECFERIVKVNGFTVKKKWYNGNNFYAILKKGKFVFKYERILCEGYTGIYTEEDCKRIYVPANKSFSLSFGSEGYIYKIDNLRKWIEFTTYDTDMNPVFEKKYKRIKRFFRYKKYVDFFNEKQKGIVLA